MRSRTAFVISGIFITVVVASSSFAQVPVEPKACITSRIPGSEPVSQALRQLVYGRNGGRRSLATVRVAQSGNLALVEATGDAVIPANPLDLRGRSLTFTPNGGGYDVEVGDSPPEAGLGRAVEIGDDASYFYDLDFTFPFFGEDHRRAFLNSDGNVTLQFSDSTSRTNVFGFLSGPPRIAALYADLNPELGGKVRVLDAPDRFVVTWEEISEYLELNRSTFQIVLEASGVIHLRYGDEIAARSGVSGITPGFDTSRFGAVDWSSGTADVFGPAFEHFTSHPELQLGPTASRFYSNFADQYDFLIVWTNFSTHMDGAFAFERNVQNDVRGIGLGSFDWV